MKALKDGLRRYNAGNQVVLKHLMPDGRVYYTKYFHLQGVSQLRVGDRVARGEVIGQVGRTGNVPPGGDTHLHFEVRDANSRRICPTILPGREVFEPTPWNPPQSTRWLAYGRQNFYGQLGPEQLLVNGRPEWSQSYVEQVARDYEATGLYVITRIEQTNEPFQEG